MTPEERELCIEVGNLLGKFEKLPQNWVSGGHTEDLHDFRYHIHRLQDMIAARAGLRSLLEKESKDFYHFKGGKMPK